MNSVQVTGVVANDIKELGGLVKFTISDKNGNQRQFVDCVAFNNTAELILKLLKKGTLVACNGILSLKPYTNKEGKEVKQTQVIVNVFEVLKDGKEYIRDQPKPSQPKAVVEETKEEYKEPQSVNINDDDLPF